MSNGRLLALSGLVTGNVVTAFVYRAFLYSPDDGPNAREAALIIGQALSLSFMVCCGPGDLWQRFALACGGMYGIRLASWPAGSTDAPWINITFVATLWFAMLRLIGLRLVHRDDDSKVHSRQFSIRGLLGLTVVASIYFAVLVAEPYSPFDHVRPRGSLIRPYEAVSSSYAFYCVPILAVAALTWRSTVSRWVAALALTSVANLVAVWEALTLIDNSYGYTSIPSFHEMMGLWARFSLWKFHFFIATPILLNLLAMRWLGWRLTWPQWQFSKRLAMTST